jgi:hypothetical protein
MSLSLEKTIVNKYWPLMLFIISLIPGDRFYGSYGLAQSYFVLPLLVVYLINKRKLPPVILLRNTGLFMLIIITIQLILFNFNGLTEWYRTSGGIILTFVLVTLYINDQIVIKKQVKWIMFAAAFPVVAYYLGFWYMGNAANPRATFLRHDPNHLAHLLLYGVIALCYYFQESKNKKTKRLIIIAIISFFMPLVSTYSRTAIIIFFTIIVVYLYVFRHNARNLRNPIIFMIIIASIISTIALSNFITGSKIFRMFEVRFEESEQSRLTFYTKGLTLIKENFVLGVGIKDFQNSGWRIRNGFYRTVSGSGNVYSVSTTTHNGFIDIFLIGGVFMFISFLFLISYPSYLIFSFKGSINKGSLQRDRFLIYSLYLSFVLINMTYSLYNSKLGWWGIALSYLIVSPYYFKPRGYNLLK